MSRQVQVMVGGPPTVSGAPSRVKIEVVLTWEETLALVREGAFPTAVVDDVLVQVLTIGGVQ